jgi:cyclopropane fatty-acyl-phospholipid synthase-like methyltransferase
VKPCSAASARNRDPILAVLREYLTAGTVLEIGAGTGQHAVHFAAALPELTWIVTDREDNLPGIASWISAANLPNLEGPLALDVFDWPWPVASVDYVFSANTAHIMSWSGVCATFAGVGRVLNRTGRFVLYGPFNRNGEFTSESNRAFDAVLRSRDPDMGLRDDGALDELARTCGLARIADVPMPANNRTLVWSNA